MVIGCRRRVLNSLDLRKVRDVQVLGSTRRRVASPKSGPRPNPRVHLARAEHRHSLTAAVAAALDGALPPILFTTSTNIAVLLIGSANSQVDAAAGGGGGGGGGGAVGAVVGVVVVVLLGPPNSQPGLTALCRFVALAFAFAFALQVASLPACNPSRSVIRRGVAMSDKSHHAIEQRIGGVRVAEPHRLALAARDDEHHLE